MKVKAKKKALTFAACGLNKELNFLQAPKCGCDGYCNLILNTEDDLKDFIGAMLSEHECNCCGIFVVKQDNAGMFGTKTKDGITIYRINSSPKQIIAYVNDELNLHYYGLLEQVDENLYRIVMD